MSQAINQGVKAGRAIMSFIIPPVGIVTYFMINDKRPKAGKAYMGIAIAGLALGAIWFAKWQIDKAVKDKNAS